MIIISDTSPLSGLAITGYLPLLKQLYQRVIIPSAVAEELKRGGEEDQRILQVLSLDWIEIKHCRNRQLIEELQTTYRLDLGGSEAIALAIEMRADELLIDERLGRREASRLGLSFTGLFGVLLMAKRQKLISAIRPIMDRLIEETGFRVSKQLYHEVLTMAEENS